VRQHATSSCCCHEHESSLLATCHMRVCLLQQQLASSSTVGAAAAGPGGPYPGYAPYPSYAPYPPPPLPGATAAQTDSVIHLLTSIDNKLGALQTSMQQSPNKFNNALQV
jgi:hypothetical protein